MTPRGVEGRSGGDGARARSRAGADDGGETPSTWWHREATARAREGADADADADVVAAERADAAIIPANPRNMQLAETLAKRLLE